MQVLYLFELGEVRLCGYCGMHWAAVAGTCSCHWVENACGPLRSSLRTAGAHALARLALGGLGDLVDLWSGGNKEKQSEL